VDGGLEVGVAGLGIKVGDMFEQANVSIRRESTFARHPILLLLLLLRLR
jgi:hypothetical protein